MTRSDPPQNTSPSKETLREQAVFHRDRIDPASEDMEAAVGHFFEHIQPKEGQVIAAFWPKGREYDPRYILDDLLKAGFTCALPVTEKGSRILKFARYDDKTELEKGRFEIMQPTQKDWVEPDIIMVPFLAFDRKGYRLGYGGGYYDATLAELRAKRDITAVGVGYAQQAVLFNLPAEEHDQKLDWIVTPKEARCFTEGT